jgi:hypothetical protein
MRECRERHRKGLGPALAPPAVETAERRSGTPTTHYETDPLRGNKRAHAIARKLKAGMTPRKIAKQFDISLDEVLDIERKVT